MKIYIVDSSGSLRFSGHAGPKTVRLLAIDGNIDVGEAPPNNHSIWNGSAWVVDPAWSAVQYKEDRRIAYDEIGDQLDNITKVFKFLKAAGTDIGSDGDAQIAMSDAVKAAHPKGDN